MSNGFGQLKEKVALVARALGEDLLKEVAFLGGCTTGFLISDTVTKEGVRYTEDVDLIVNVIGYAGWTAFQKKLLARGFSMNIGDEVICRMRLGEMKVDFMPDDKDVLGFTNRWYKQALAKAQNYRLANDLIVRLVTAPYFVATKFEAYQGRGKEDLLASHDIEDILSIVDGRADIVEEVRESPKEVRNYLAIEFGRLLEHELIEYAVQGSVRSDNGRAALSFERLKALSKTSP